MSGLGSFIDEKLAVSVVDALTSNICVVDLSGKIIAVNRAWMEFSAANGNGVEQTHLGINYLDLCRGSEGSAAEEAPGFYNGIRDVINGRKSHFEIEYPCHSPSALRWFVAKVTPLMGTGEAKRVGAVVSHMNVTDRKLMEIAYARLASTDPLTDVPNRRFFEEYAELELGRLERFGGAIAVLMIDLDNFKCINDTHGHLAGDAVLKEVSAHCNRAIRSSDLFARLGGEEFVALLMGTGKAAAMQVAEKLRSIIEGLEIETTAGTLRVTGSIGVASLCPEDQSVSAALDRADKALYEAKNGGRNRVRMSD
ncbi:GGDEF domain-containing protein [Acuticoccus sp. MNP-M23]|uniref:sensor domain-containing diguanylate cyclase n=1 Tax=Acuticoccus sp. MNP-M23 TaxID=3072793 RepID=UPI0028157B33|nr:GGDEF domain-containing protein [Acuticoccus sp. MNP-M23]WMS42228.1 GGDEF domain-containing protein [Acuticoccus sp. MNP-M23]